MAKTETVERATGRSQADWYGVLDQWEAAGRPYKDIAAFLTGQHGISRWWAQKLIVEYEQDRGLRAPGARRNGTFEVSATKTINVSAATVVKAVTDSRRRRRWMGNGTLRLMASEAPTGARFECKGDTSRVAISIAEKGPSKSLVTVTHDRLTDARKAQSMKAIWRDQLTRLKTILEG
jgi:uncharacterized protein YndB with AHSA1/START domain